MRCHRYTQQIGIIGWKDAGGCSSKLGDKVNGVLLILSASISMEILESLACITHGCGTVAVFELQNLRPFTRGYLVDHSGHNKEP